jgi:hypothetical protein
MGRRSELAAVKELLDRAAAGTGGHLIVTGPSGAGKTALADAAARLARDRGLPVLRASGAAADGAPRIWEQLYDDLRADGDSPEAVVQLFRLRKNAVAVRESGPRAPVRLPIPTGSHGPLPPPGRA